MFHYKHTIKLRETDAAGLLFFSHQFSMIHDAYEALLEKIGFSFAYLVKKANFFLPIVHAESDYKSPLFVGDRITISVSVLQIGTTSFSFAYELKNSKKGLVGTAQTVHVTVDKKTGKKIPLPPKMRQALMRLL